MKNYILDITDARFASRAIYVLLFTLLLYTCF